MEMKNSTTRRSKFSEKTNASFKVQSWYANSVYETIIKWTSSFAEIVNVSALEKGGYFVYVLNNGASIDEQKLIIQ